MKMSLVAVSSAFRSQLLVLQLANHTLPSTDSLSSRYLETGISAGACVAPDFLLLLLPTQLGELPTH